MKKAITIIITGILLAYVHTVWCKTPLERKLDAYFAVPSSKGCKIAYLVSNPVNGTIYASKNHHTLFNPASLVKLATAAAALKELGSDWRFHTLFLTDEINQYGEINNLWIKGDGDPFLVIERLWKAITLLKNKGIKMIKGNIIIDNSYFDSFEFAGRRNANSRAYNSLTSPIALNFNSITVTVRPSSTEGLPAIVQTDPPTQYVMLSNRVTTLLKQTKIDIKKIALIDSDKIIVSGHISPESHQKTFYVSISHPSLYFGQVLKEMLRQNHIYVTGSLKTGRTPPGLKILLDFPSKPLALIVRDMNKFSNNFIAEQLLKHLGAVKKGEPGSTEKGINVVKEWLKKTGVEEGYILENGSGLSTKNRMSAYQITQILTAVWRDSSIRPEFVSSLPIAGVDGTAKKLWKDSPVAGTARLKTGTLTNISNVAGFITNKNGEPRTLVIMFNNCNLEQSKLKKLKIKALTTIAE